MVSKRVRGSRTGRPIMVLLDLLGRRWTLRIAWELREEARRFRELQDAIGASPTIINTRLAELREAKLVALDPDSGYRLTALGEELLRLMLARHGRAEEVAKNLAQEHTRGERTAGAVMVRSCLTGATRRGRPR